MRNVLIVMVALGLLAGLCSCFDPAPGEISIIATKNRQQAGCGVLIFNEKGKQVGQETTDMKGMCYIKNLKPGNYTLKFAPIGGGDLYPAVKQVSLVSGDSQQVRVELTEEPPVTTETE